MINKRKLKLRKFLAVVLCAATVFSMTACQKSPKSSIVVNKDLDKLIEKAKAPKENEEEVNSVLVEENYDTYKTTIEDKNLHVKATVDAKVDIPKTDKMSVFRVSQKKMTQELLDAVRKELMGDTALYEGAALMQPTKEELEERIASWSREMESGKDDPKWYKEAQEYMEKLEEQYNQALSEISFKNRESDGKIQSIPEKHKENPMERYYEWLNGLTDEEGETFYGVSDGKDGTYSSLYVLNSQNRNNFLSFRKNDQDYNRLTMWGFGAEPTLTKIDDLYTSYDYDPSTVADEASELSLEKAVGIADEFLRKVGINDGTTEFRYYEGGKDTELTELKSDLIARKYYILTYMRYIDGGFVTAGGDSKMNIDTGEKGGDYTKKEWHTEKIEFRINDSGIVGFDYNSPICINETVVDDSALKSFEEVCTTFEKMIAVTSADKYGMIELDIDRVTLGYTVISEPNSYDTGLLVPVWDFFGVKKSMNNGEMKEAARYKSWLTINAIDNSIIDRELGY